MAAFTSISGASNFSDHTYFQEIENAIHERWEACGRAYKPTWAVSTGSTVAEDVIQPATFWSARQQAISDLVLGGTNFKWLKAGSSGVPPTTPNITNMVTGETSLPNWDSATQLWNWATDSTGGGPRRRLADGSWTYGNCQIGDRLGYWLIEDMQKALKYIRFVNAGIAEENWGEGSYRAPPSGVNASYESVYADAVAEHDGDAATAGWSTAVGPPPLLILRNQKGWWYSNSYQISSYTWCVESVSIDFPAALSSLESVQSWLVCKFVGSTGNELPWLMEGTRAQIDTVGPGDYASLGVNNQTQTGTTRTFNLRDFSQVTYNWDGLGGFVEEDLFRQADFDTDAEWDDPHIVVSFDFSNV